MAQDVRQWGLILSGPILPRRQEALAQFLSTFSYFPGSLKTPMMLDTFFEIHTMCIEDRPLDADIRGVLEILDLNWAWVRKKDGVLNGEIRDRHRHLYLGPGPKPDTWIKELLSVHFWDPLRHPKSAHEHLVLEAQADPFETTI